MYCELFAQSNMWTQRLHASSPPLYQATPHSSVEWKGAEKRFEMTFPEVSNCNTATNNIIIPMSFNDARLDLKNHEQVFITNTR